MNAESLRELLKNQPLRPFILQLPNGQTYEIRHPEFVIRLKSTMVMGFLDCDRIGIASRLQINNIDFADHAITSA